MLICRGNALELDALRVIAGTIAQEFERRMLLGLWNDGESKSYMIAMDEAPVTRSPGFEPIALALPDGAFIAVAPAEPAPTTC